jgi:preprotein translocase subunit SecA
MGRSEMVEAFGQRIRKLYEDKQGQVGPDAMNMFVRMVMLQIVDTQWKDHLYALDHLKEGIGLRGYGQRDPLVEYKKESFNMFQALMDRIDEEMLRWIYLSQPMRGPGDEGGAPAAPAERSVSVRREERASPLPEPRPVREPELAFAGARTRPRNLTFNDPGVVLSGSGSALGAAEPAEARGGMDGEVQTVRREGKKVGRNDPCPCGSGRKYKKCHGA